MPATTNPATPPPAPSFVERPRDEGARTVARRRSEHGTGLSTGTFACAASNRQCALGGCKEIIPTRNMNTTPPRPAYNPMQFVRVGPASLHQSAHEQMGRATGVQEGAAASASTAPAAKVDEEEWQMNLDSWKSSRRKRNEEVIERLQEVRRFENEGYGHTARRGKTFKEMLEERQGKHIASLATFDEEEGVQTVLAPCPAGRAGDPGEELVPPPANGVEPRREPDHPPEAACLRDADPEPLPPPAAGGTLRDAPPEDGTERHPGEDQQQQQKGPWLLELARLPGDVDTASPIGRERRAAATRTGEEEEEREEIPSAAPACGGGGGGGGDAERELLEQLRIQEGLKTPSSLDYYLRPWSGRTAEPKYSSVSPGGGGGGGSCRDSSSQLDAGPDRSPSRRTDFYSHWLVQEAEQRRIHEQQSRSSVGRTYCASCERELGRTAAMAIDSLELYFHLSCFRCCVCGVSLGCGAHGINVRVRGNRLHCSDCFSSDEGIKLTRV